MSYSESFEKRLSFAQILQILQARRENDGVLKAQMISVRDVLKKQLISP